MALTPPDTRRRWPLGRRQRWSAAQAGLCITLVVALVSAVMALGVNQREMSRTARIDESLRRLAHVRATTDEIARAARRYVLSGDVEDRQLVEAIASDLRAERVEIREGLSLGEALTLDSAVDQYVRTVTRVMDVFYEDFLTRLDHFEVSLLDARNELATVLDRSAARQHRERDASIESRTFARIASWATAAACVAGLLLALALVAQAERRRSNRRPGADAEDDRAAAADPDQLGDHGALPMLREPHDVVTLVDHAIAELRLDAMARHVRLRNEGRGTTKVIADRVRVGYVLDTLLEMAIVRSRPGDEVTVHVATGETDVRIAVIDTGQRAVTPKAERRLELCRNVIESQAGRLEVQSAVAGTTSWFTLPRATPRS